MTTPTQAEIGLQAAIRAAKLAIFAATVERCAQVVDEFNECDAYSNVDKLHITKHIAAAIRALKDEP